MLERLINIYNAILQVEVKGRSTVVLGACIASIEQIIQELQQQEEIKID